MNQHYDVIIVGAGPGGIYSAYWTITGNVDRYRLPIMKRDCVK